MSRRRHPLAAMVLWLGLSLCTCLGALVYSVAQLPTDRTLEATHLDGMKHGYELCIAWEQEQRQEAKPLLLGGL